MIGRILSLSVRMRWLVAFLTLVVIGFGLWQITKLPIDAVPDVTNRQVQISTFAPTLGPVDIEKQVTFPVETALAGIPGLEMTRSISRNGFSQVTAVFTDRTDIYFARQQVTERLAQSRDSLPPTRSRSSPAQHRPWRDLLLFGRLPSPRRQGREDGRRQAGLAIGRQLSHPRGRAADHRAGEGGISPHRAGLDHPPADARGARRRRRRLQRRLCEAISDRAEPERARQLWAVRDGAGGRDGACKPLRRVQLCPPRRRASLSAPMLA
jgi:hypothetical protein